MNQTAIDYTHIEECLKQLKAQLEQARANYHATAGAIQFAESLLAYARRDQGPTEPQKE